MRTLRENTQSFDTDFLGADCIRSENMHIIGLGLRLIC